MADEVVADGRAYAKLRPPWIHIQLVRLLAEGNLTHAKLAKRYDVHTSAITAFKARNLAQIEEIKADLENQFAGLWIADKKQRVASLQRDAERCELLIETLDEWSPCDCQDPECGAKIYNGATLPKLLKAKREALHAAAEELGQLPNRMTVQLTGQQQVRHEIVGVDLDRAFGADPAPG